MATMQPTSYESTVSDIEETLGSVPGFMSALPEDVLVHEWPTFKQHTLGETSISPEMRELVGVAVAANIKCPYCLDFHRSAAELHGATEEQLQEIAVLAGLTARWSSMIHAQDYDIDEFRREVDDIGAFLGEKAAAADD